MKRWLSQASTLELHTRSGHDDRLMLVTACLAALVLSPVPLVAQTLAAAPMSEPATTENIASINPLPARGSPEAAVAALRKAALAGSSAQAEPWLAPDLMLVSQSGKVYGRTEALQDIAGGFQSWENREFQRAGSGNNVRLTFINRRERVGRDGKMLPATDYRVVQLWEKHRNAWRLVLQTSVKLAA